MSRATRRAAAMTLLTGYATAASVKLQTYPGRPRSINAPCAFVDRISDPTIEYSGPVIILRQPTVEVMLLHGSKTINRSGSFDTADAVEQADAFVDGFIDYVRTRRDQAGANSTIAVVAAEDDSNYVPEWLPPEQQSSYYGTRITLGGFDSDN